MTAIVPGWGLSIAAPVKADEPEAIATYRCIECTLMRCHGPGLACWECKPALNMLVVCPYDGTLVRVGELCETCKSSPG